MLIDILIVLALALVPFLILWAVSLAANDASIIDIYWGPSFAVTALIALLVSGPITPLGWLMFALTAVWGGRLGAYLFWRNHGAGEDWRYQKMRAAHADNFAIWSLYSIFGLQWGVMAIVSLPVVAGIVGGGEIGLLTYIGIAVYAVGLLFEAVGDWQLASFKADPANAGKVMDKGLWAWTRHPNYFGDATIWWGLGLIAAGAGYWWALIGPFVMNWFLVNISGKAMLERKLVGARAGYAEYVAKTSGFFPLPPKS